MSKLDYTIGDEIVCIKNHSDGIVKEGEIYICKALLHEKCKCGGYIVDVGIRESPNETGKVWCIDCNSSYDDDSIWYIDASLFKKLDTLVNINELLEVLEQPAFNNL